MRYKVVKKTQISHHHKGTITNYFVMYEKKIWCKKEPVWRYCRERTSYDSWRGEPVQRGSLTEAEDYIKIQMRIDNEEFTTEDIKIYECRDSKLNKILENEK
jgi:hypothetical protein